MAIHSTSRPALQGRVLVRIPATFTATGGLSVTKANGIWTLEPDWSGLTELATLLEPDSKDLWVWDPVTEVYNTMSIAALGASLFTGTSITSNTIGTGAFTFVTQAGKLWPVGGTVVISSDAAPSTDYMVATVTSYSSTSLVVDVGAGGNHGSGAHTDWTISLAGEQGVPGTAATITAGTTTTLAEGSSATVANSGSSSAAVFDFGIPRGACPAIGFTFDSTSTADSDPGAGKVKFNHATPASITAIYFDNADADTNDVTAWLDSFDDSTNTTKGTLTATDVTAPATKMIFSVSGSVVDGTGYRKVTVAHVSGGTLFTNARRLAWVFSRTGDDGGGVASATANGVGYATGATAMTSTAALTNGQIVVGQTGNPPLPKTVTGDVTIDAAGATAIGNNKVTFAMLSTAVQTLPTVQNFTSGSGTYTLPANCKWIRVRLIGGGGGGGGSGTTPGAAGAGGNTTFGSAFLTGNGGALGIVAPGTPAAGGAATGGDVNIPGGSGGNSSNQVNSFGGQGGNGAFGGGGGQGFGTAGTAGATNSGGGGGGAGCSGTANTGGGGGAGGYVEKIITSPSATYAYAVGAAGTAGTAGGSGFAGGAGAAGRIIVEEFYK